MGNVFLILGILSVVYYIGVVAYSGFGTSFVWIWLVAAVFFLGLWGICKVPAVQMLFYKIPGAVRALAGILLGIGILIFLFAQCCIISGMTAGTEKPADYVIVLGAQVRGSNVSQALKQRLDCAAEYLHAHSDTVAIVSGAVVGGAAVVHTAVRLVVAQHIVAVGVFSAATHQTECQRSGQHQSQSGVFHHNLSFLPVKSAACAPV